jgi:ribosome-associated protein
LEREKARLTNDGALVITSQRHRAQPQNIADCLAKLSTIIERALTPPKVRRRTKKPRSMIAKRLAGKRHRSETKQLRRQPPD